MFTLTYIATIQGSVKKNATKITKIQNEVILSAMNQIRTTASTFYEKEEIEKHLKRIGVKNGVSSIVTITAKKKNDYNEFVVIVNNAFTRLSPLVTNGVKQLIQAIRNCSKRIAQFEPVSISSNIQFALDELENWSNTDICRLAKDTISKRKSVSRDLGDIKISKAEQQYALAHFLHSEQLAYIWLMKRSANPVPHMYTQRGMCETCNPFMLKALRSAPTKVGIMSTYLANRPDRE